MTGAAVDSRMRELAEEDPEQFEAAMAALKGRLFVPHPNQIGVLESKARFRTLAAGRRFGKTKVGARIIAQRARKPDSMNWWIANSYRNVRRGYKEVVRQIPPSMLAKPAPVSTSTDLILTFKNGASIEFYSAGNPEALAGEGVDFVVMDEGGLIEDRVWNQLVRPTLADNLGDALLISTPRGHNWFYKMWLRGNEGKTGYESWQFSQTDNPYIDPAETEALREELPEIFYRQEILAEFLAGGSSIFGTALAREETVAAGLARPYGHIYVGIDLADKNDFTVIDAVRGSDRVPVLHERFNQVGWTIQKEQIATAISGLRSDPNVEGVTVLLDSTGIGDVIYEDLMYSGTDVVPIKFTNDWKEKAVKLLAADMERGKAFILEEQKKEFEGYEFEVTNAGRFKFEAATDHDDEVSAKLLQHWGIHHNAMPEINVYSEADEQNNRVDTGLPESSGDGAPPDSVQEMMERAGVWH